MSVVDVWRSDGAIGREVGRGEQRFARRIHGPGALFDEIAIVARVRDQTRGDEAETRRRKAGLEPQQRVVGAADAAAEVEPAIAARLGPQRRLVESHVEG